MAGQAELGGGNLAVRADDGVGRHDAVIDEVLKDDRPVGRVTALSCQALDGCFQRGHNRADIAKLAGLIKYQGGITLV